MGGWTDGRKEGRTDGRTKGRKSRKEVGQGRKEVKEGREEGRRDILPRCHIDTCFSYPKQNDVLKY
jgi:hypothetical protein